MKRIRFVLLSVAILTAVGAVITTTSKASVPPPTTYFKVGTQYYPAGIEGYDYVCEFGHFSTCTYWFDPATGTYKEYKGGKILWLR